MDDIGSVIAKSIGWSVVPSILFFIFKFTKKQTNKTKKKAWGFGLLTLFFLLRFIPSLLLRSAAINRGLDDSKIVIYGIIISFFRVGLYLTAFFVGLNKITPNESSFSTQAQNSSLNDRFQSATNKERIEIPSGMPLKTIVDKAFLLIEEGSMDQATKYVNYVLDWEPHNGLAYLARLLIQLNINKKEYLCYYKDLIRDNLDYLRFIKYGDAQDIIEVREIVEKYNDVDPRLWAEMEDKYQQAIKLISEAEKEFPHGISIYSKEILPLLNSIPNYKDVQQKIRWCNMRIGESVRSIIKTASDYDSNSVSSIERSIDILSEVSDAPEAQLLLNKLNNELETTKKWELHGFMKWLFWTIIIVIICVWIAVITIALVSW